MIAEAFQESFQFASNQFASTYHSDRYKNGGVGDMANALNTSMSETFGSQEGLESALVGFLVGLAIGVMSYIGFRNTGSPTLFRLTIAFVSISLGFFVIWSGYMIEDFLIKSGSIERGIQTLGIIIQTVGYF